jgi:hypothetical protein
VDQTCDHQQKGLPGWIWAVLIVVPAVILFRIVYWWLLIPSYKRMAAMEIDTPRRVKKVISSEPDDLTRLKGIGPKISRALQDAGVFSFAQLALLNADELQLVLDQANARMTDISAIQAQARLAASGDWEGLQELQNSI